MHTFNEAGSLWLIEMAHKRTIEDDRRKLIWLRPMLGDLLLSEIDRFCIAKIGKSKALATSPATANRYLALIRAILRRAAFEWEWIAKPPRIQLYKESPRRVRWLTAEQTKTIFDELPLHQREAVVFALSTGLRHANVAGLRWDQVDLKRRTAWFFEDETKNSEELLISLNDTAIDVLKRRAGQHREFVFCYRDKPVGRFTTKVWYKALKRAGIENFRWHDLRHTWASWLVQEGVSLYSLQEMGGWKTPQMVRKYAHLSPSVNLANACKIDSFMPAFDQD